MLDVVTQSARTDLEDTSAWGAGDNTGLNHPSLTQSSSVDLQWFTFSNDLDESPQSSEHDFNPNLSRVVCSTKTEDY